MSNTTFVKYLILTIGLSAICVYGVSWNPRMAPYVDISYWAISAFTVLSIIVYILTTIFEKHKMDGQLTGLVLLNVLLKFLISIGLVVAYYKLASPEDGIFVVPFIIVYVIFTIFETYFMNELAKSKH